METRRKTQVKVLLRFVKRQAGRLLRPGRPALAERQSIAEWNLSVTAQRRYAARSSCAQCPVKQPSGQQSRIVGAAQRRQPMQAPRVRATHVSGAIVGLRRKFAAGTGSAVIDGAGDIPADSAHKRDTTRRLQVRAAHANAAFVKPLHQSGRNVAVRRCVKLRAPKRDAISDAASAALRACRHGRIVECSWPLSWHALYLSATAQAAPCSGCPGGMHRIKQQNIFGRSVALMLCSDIFIT